MDEETFLKIEYETEHRHGFGCGYWRVCDDHSCPCVLSSRGFDIEVYDKMKKTQEG